MMGKKRKENLNNVEDIPRDNENMSERHPYKKLKTGT